MSETYPFHVILSRISVARPSDWLERTITVEGCKRLSLNLICGTFFNYTSRSKMSYVGPKLLVYPPQKWVIFVLLQINFKTLAHIHRRKNGPCRHYHACTFHTKWPICWNSHVTTSNDQITKFSILHRILLKCFTNVTALCATIFPNSVQILLKKQSQCKQQPQL